MGCGGQSALFDAVLFFMILTSASVVIYMIPTSSTTSIQESAVDEYRSGFAHETLGAVLQSTLSDVPYAENGVEKWTSQMSVLRAAQVYMECLFEEERGRATCELSALKSAIEAKFDLALQGRYRYELKATMVKGGESISQLVAGSEPPLTTRYASKRELNTGEGTLTLEFSIWE